MILVTPIELISVLTVLVRGGMDSQSMVGITFRRSLFGKFVLHKGFGMFCLAFAMTGVKSRPMKEESAKTNLYDCRTRFAIVVFSTALSSCRRKRS